MNGAQPISREEYARRKALEFLSPASKYYNVAVPSRNAVAPGVASQGSLSQFRSPLRRRGLA